MLTGQPPKPSQCLLAGQVCARFIQAVQDVGQDLYHVTVLFGLHPR